MIIRASFIRAFFTVLAAGSVQGIFDLEKPIPLCKPPAPLCRLGLVPSCSQNGNKTEWKCIPEPLVQGAILYVPRKAKDMVVDHLMKTLKGQGNAVSPGVEEKSEQKNERTKHGDDRKSVKIMTPEKQNGSGTRKPTRVSEKQTDKMKIKKKGISKKIKVNTENNMGKTGSMELAADLIFKLDDDPPTKPVRILKTKNKKRKPKKKDNGKKSTGITGNKSGKSKNTDLEEAKPFGLDGETKTEEPKDLNATQKRKMQKSGMKKRKKGFKYTRRLDILGGSGITKEQSR